MSKVHLVTAAAFTATPQFVGKDILLDNLTGTTVTMPEATGTGFLYTFHLGKTITSNTHKVITAVGDAIVGTINGALGDGTAAVGWRPTGSQKSLSLNGSTTGGHAGDTIQLIDAKKGQWIVAGDIKQTGTKATPFIV